MILTQARSDLSASLAPCEDKRSQAKIMALLERLAAHYPSQHRSEVQEKHRWQDWLFDLKDKPFDLIEAAAQAWRQSTNAWFPTPGQFLAIVNPPLSYRRTLITLIDRHLAKPDYVEPEDQPQQLDEEGRAELAKILTMRPASKKDRD